MKMNRRMKRAAKCADGAAAAMVLFFVATMSSCASSLQSMSNRDLWTEADRAYAEQDYAYAADAYRVLCDRAPSYLSLYLLGLADKHDGNYMGAEHALIASIAKWEDRVARAEVPADEDAQFRFECYDQLTGICALRNAERPAERSAAEDACREFLRLRESAAEEVAFWRANPDSLVADSGKKALQSRRKDPGHVQVGWRAQNVRAVYGEPISIDRMRESIQSSPNQVDVWTYVRESRDGYAYQVAVDSEWYRTADELAWFLEDRNSAQAVIGQMSSNEKRATKANNEAMPQKPLELDAPMSRVVMTRIFVNGEGVVVGWTESSEKGAISDGRVTEQ